MVSSNQEVIDEPPVRMWLSTKTLKFVPGTLEPQGYKILGWSFQIRRTMFIVALPLRSLFKEVPLSFKDWSVEGKVIVELEIENSFNLDSVYYINLCIRSRKPKMDLAGVLPLHVNSLSRSLCAISYLIYHILSLSRERGY